MVASGVLLILAALFRLQSFTAMPALILVNWMVHGWRRGTARSVVLVALVVAIQVLVTLGLQARFPGYWNAVYGFHFSRARISTGLRAMRAYETMRQPEMLLGSLAALLLLASPDRRVRALAVLALVTTLATCLGAKSLFSHYFLFCLPFCAICLGIAVGNQLATAPRRWPVLLCVMTVCAIQLYPCVNRVRLGKKLHAEYAEKLAVVERIPEKVVLADPLFVVLGHKSFVDDYYCPDSYIPLEGGRFEEWVEGLSQKSEAILIDDLFYERSISDRTYEAFKRAGSRSISPPPRSARPGRAGRAPRRSPRTTPSRRKGVRDAWPEDLPGIIGVPHRMDRRSLAGRSFPCYHRKSRGVGLRVKCVSHPTPEAMATSVSPGR